MQNELSIYLIYIFQITEVLEKFANLGADIENFELVVHDENCNYFIERH